MQSRLLAQLREARGFVLVGAARRLFGLLQGFQIFGRIQFLQLLLPAVPGSRQLLGLHAEAPCQRNPAGQALVQLRQAIRIQLGAVEVGVQAALGFFQLRLAAGEQGNPFGKRGFDMFLFLQRVDGGVERIEQAVLLAFQRL